MTIGTGRTEYQNISFRLLHRVGRAVVDTRYFFKVEMPQCSAYYKIKNKHNQRNKNCIKD